VDRYVSHGRLFPGGQAFNFAAHAGQLGAIVTLATCVGTDFWGAWLLDRATLAGVDTLPTERRRGASFVTSIEHTSDGERTSVEEAEGATAGWEVSDPVLATAGTFDVVYATPWARAGARLALVRRSAGTLVAFDCMSLAPDRPLPEELPYVEVAFAPVPRGWEEPSLVRSLAAAGASVVVATRGAEGSAVYRAGSLVDERPPGPGPIVDTLGAGDAFAAAFCVTLMRTGDLMHAHEAAVHRAAAACAHLGGSLGPGGEWDVPRTARTGPVRRAAASGSAG
jgi:fructoselysine 6-kinase